MGWLDGTAIGSVTAQVASEDALDVRDFRVEERLSTCFSIRIRALSDNPDIDFDEVVGKPASFTIGASSLLSLVMGGSERAWKGVVSQIHQVETDHDADGLTAYELTIVPVLWLLTQRRNYRIFQQMSELDIAKKLLEEWEIEPILEVTAERYKTRRYRVQYAESDYAFLSRMLEDAGITHTFRQDGEETKLVLSDALETREPREPSLTITESPTATWLGPELATRLRIGQRVRPGRYTVADHDYRKPSRLRLEASATDGLDVEQRLERFHYVPGAFLYGSDRGEASPHADDRGRTRTDDREAQQLAARRLEAKRSLAKRATFSTNALDLEPGKVVRFDAHPRSDLGVENKWLVVATTLVGGSAWPLTCEVVSASSAYRPALVTPRPRIAGVESATVVGPPGEEIHTDEFGRIRVQFHWDREGSFDEKSSCWLHVSQPWSGSGYGAVNLPRVGQEVLVDFLGGDPDRPIVTGRVHTQTQPVPYGLPNNRTQSGWRSASSPANGGFNEIMFEDAAGRELVRMRAERDRSTVVNNDCTTLVGNDRSVTVVADDAESVLGEQTVRVLGDRSVKVEGSERHEVTGDILSATKERRIFETEHTFRSDAENHVLQSTQSICLNVGGSTLYMTPDFIILQAGYVYVNPGVDALVAAINGRAPQTPQEAEAQRTADARREAIVQMAAQLRAEVAASFPTTPAQGGRRDPNAIRHEMALEGMSRSGRWREGTPEYEAELQRRLSANDGEFQARRATNIEQQVRARIQSQGATPAEINEALGPMQGAVP
jgi:type VI secretion system secreted protein VgrG